MLKGWKYHARIRHINIAFVLIQLMTTVSGWKVWRESLSWGRKMFQTSKKDNCKNINLGVIWFTFEMAAITNLLWTSYTTVRKNQQRQRTHTHTLRPVRDRKYRYICRTQHYRPYICNLVYSTIDNGLFWTAVCFMQRIQLPPNPLSEVNPYLENFI